MAKYHIPNSNCLFGWNIKQHTEMKLAEYIDCYNENAVWLAEIIEKARNEITKQSARTAEALPQITKTPSAKRNRRRVLQKMDPLSAINENIIGDTLEIIEPRQPVVTINARSVSPPSAAPASASTLAVAPPVPTISPPITVIAPPVAVVAPPATVIAPKLTEIISSAQTENMADDSPGPSLKRKSKTRADQDTHEPSSKRNRELDEAEREEVDDVVVIPPSTTLNMPRNKAMFGSASRLPGTLCTPLVTNTASASSAGSGSGSHRVLPNICMTSFLPRVTPNQPSLKEVEDKRRQVLAEKEDKAEQTRLRKQQLMLAKADEQRRMREERHKLAAQKRQEHEKQVVEQTVKTMAKKFDTIATTSTKPAVDEKTEKQKMREKRVNDAQQRRKQEEEARRVRTEQLEMERRRMEELAQKRREVEEQERQRKVAELKRQEEERREEMERERQREAERLRGELELKEREEAEKRRLRDERERQDKLERERQEMEKQMERVRQKKAEEDRRREEERQKAKEREAEKDMLRAAQQEQKHLQALIDKHNAQLALNKNPNPVATSAVPLQTKVGMVAKPMMQTGSTIVPATASLLSKIGTTTAAVVKSPPAMARVLPTPIHNDHRATMTLTTGTVPLTDKATVPEPFTQYISRAMLREDNYDISGIRSDDSTDDESEPKRRIPPWAQGSLLRAALASQTLSPPDIDIVFANLLEPLDLNAIFRKKKARFNQRTSSGCWTSPMYKPSGKGYATSSSTSKLDDVM